VLFLTLLGGFPLDAVRYGYSLFDRLASVYFSLDVFAKRGFACRFNERHGYLRFVVIGEDFMFVVVRIICGLRMAGLGVLRADKPALTRGVAAEEPSGGLGALRADKPALTRGVADLTRGVAAEEPRGFTTAPLFTIPGLGVLLASVGPVYPRVYFMSLTFLSWLNC
jgi:hypothetical protein